MGRTLDEDDVLKEIDRWIGYLDEDMITRIKISIEKIPSAQPYTDEEIQKMQDLEQAELDKAFELGKEEGRKEAQREPQWIPCSETVDIPDHEILACDLHGEMMFGYLEYKDEQWICESEAELMYDPIAWMPLPQPFKT